MTTHNLAEAFQTYEDTTPIIIALAIIFACIGATVVVAIMTRHYSDQPFYSITLGTTSGLTGACLGLLIGIAGFVIPAESRLLTTVEENLHQNFAVEHVEVQSMHDDRATFEYREQGQPYIHTIEAQYVSEYDVMAPVADDMSMLPIIEDSPLAQYIDATE